MKKFVNNCNFDSSKRKIADLAEFGCESQGERESKDWKWNETKIRRNLPLEVLLST